MLGKKQIPTSMTDSDTLSSFNDVKQFIRKMPATTIENERLSSVEIRIPEYQRHKEFSNGVHNSVSNVTSRILRKIDDEQFSSNVSEKQEGSDGKVAYIELTERN